MSQGLSNLKSSGDAHKNTLASLRGLHHVYISEEEASEGLYIPHHKRSKGEGRQPTGVSDVVKV